MTKKREAMARNQEQSAGRTIDSYPILLTSHHMRELFGLSVGQFYAREALGDFLFAENRPRIGKKSWSRDRVKAYFDGQLVEITTLKLARKKGKAA